MSVVLTLLSGACLKNAQSPTPPTEPTRPSYIVIFARLLVMLTAIALAIYVSQGGGVPTPWESDDDDNGDDHHRFEDDGAVQDDGGGGENGRRGRFLRY